MERLLVLGCPGAGKSTLSRALGEALDLPVIHLDRLWWRSGWRNPTPEEFDALLDQALAGERWVMDGNYLRTLPARLARADAVVLLDYPRRLCLFRVLRRTLRWLGHTRPDMGEGCPERLEPGFVRWIWDFPRTQRPQVLALLENWPGALHVFRAPRDCAAFLAELERRG